MSEPDVPREPDGQRTVSYDATTGRSEVSSNETQGGDTRFRLIRLHAEGGLGEVFLAEDTEIRRVVAVKSIRRQRADEEGSRGRFVAEAQITGGLEHPGIVPVYGLGAHPDGRPWYAMRFVQGDNLKAAIQQFHEEFPSSTEQTGSRFNTLAFRQLLGRFIDVCNAIAYAHSQRVVHRDLKPGNIMLGQFGETLVVDWGLAKVLATSSTDMERSRGESDGSGEMDTTLAGAIVGTPAYMSPEQASGDWKQLGPATDIYSLGATLYALLTNRPPIAGQTSQELVDRARRGEWTPLIVAQPDVPPGLDAVCRRAMALAPADRYASALDLARDLECWLADEPVTAYRHEPVAERVRRWSRKNPGPVAAIGATVFVGLLGLAASALVLGQKNQELHRANRRVLAESRRTAIAQRQTSAVNAFLVDDLLAQAAPDKQPFHEHLTVVELLQRAAKNVESSEKLRDQPEVEAEVREAIGRSLASLGRFAEARVHLERAAALQDPRDSRTAAKRRSVYYLLADVCHSQDDVSAAIGWIDRYFSSNPPPESRESPEALRVRLLQAMVCAKDGRYSEAESLARELADEAARMLDDSDPTRIEAREVLADILSIQFKNFPEAMALYEENLAALARRGEPEYSHSVLTVRLRLSEQLAHQGQFRESERMLRGILDLRERHTLPEGHHDTIIAAAALGALQTNMAKYDAAAHLLHANYEQAAREYGPDHSCTWLARRAYAIQLVKSAALVPDPRKQIAQAELLCQYNLELCERKQWHPPHANYLHSLTDLAMAITAAAPQSDASAKRWADAETRFEQLCGLVAKHRHPHSFDAIAAHLNRATMLSQKPGGATEASQLCAEWIERADQSLPKGLPANAYFHNIQGNLLLAQYRFGAAEREFETYFRFCADSERVTPHERYAAAQLLGACRAFQKHVTRLRDHDFPAGSITQIRLDAANAYPSISLLARSKWEFPDVGQAHVLRQQFLPDTCYWTLPTDAAKALEIHGSALLPVSALTPCKLSITPCVEQVREESGELADDDERDGLLPMSPRDRIRARLRAGALYRISIAASAFAPYLRLEDSAGRSLLVAQRGGPGTAPADFLEYVPGEDAEHSVVVVASQPDGRGAYRLRIQEFAPEGSGMSADGVLYSAEK